MTDSIAIRITCLLLVFEGWVIVVVVVVVVVGGGGGGGGGGGWGGGGSVFSAEGKWDFRQLRDNLFQKREVLIS